MPRGAKVNAPLPSSSGVMRPVLSPLCLLLAACPAARDDAPVVPTDGPGWTASAPTRCAGATAWQPASLTGGLLDGPVDTSNARSLFVGGGTAVADLDDNGLLDVVTTSRGDGETLWLQTAPRRFEAVPLDPEGLGPLRTGGVTAVDVEGDGDLDLFFAVYEGPDRLLLNDGDATFTPADWGLAGPDEGLSLSSAWADVDGDGRLDAFVARYGGLLRKDGLPPGDPSSLFLWRDGAYTDTLAGSDHPLQRAHTFSGAWMGAPDPPTLLTVNDFGWRVPSLRLTFGADGVPSERADVGLEQAAENMGVALGDLNGDGTPDAVMAAWDVVGVFVSDPASGRWFDEGEARGITLSAPRGQHTAWGASLDDLDRDGDLDLTVAFGKLSVQTSHDNPEVQRDAVWLQDDEGAFVESAEALGLAAPTRGRGVVVADLDADGALDLVRPDLLGPLRLDWGPCAAPGHWLTVAPRTEGPNPFGIGAEIEVVAGGTTQRRWVHAGGQGYTGSGPPQVHFGLGDHAGPVTVRIRWPDGRQTTFDDVPVDQHVQVAPR